MFYRLWCLDLGAGEPEFSSGEAFTSLRRIMKDKLMGSEEEVYCNALCGLSPGEYQLFLSATSMTPSEELDNKEEKVEAKQKGNKC